MNPLQQIKDRAARAKELADKAIEFNKLWEHNQGALFLKSENTGLEWKKSIAEYFFGYGQRFNQDVPQLASDVLLLAEVVEGLMHELAAARETIDAVISVDEKWSLEQERIGNKGICIPTLNSIDKTLSTARERLGIK